MMAQSLTGTYFHKKICATCSGCRSKFDGWQSERRHILILHNYPWGEKNECPRFCNHFGFCPDFVSADINPIVLQYYYMNHSKIVERSGTWGLANNYQDPGDVISKKLRCHCSPINFPNDKHIHHITEKNNEDIFSRAGHVRRVPAKPVQDLGKWGVIESCR